ncbi:NUMOD4 motif-containing HNH endonuclease [Mucilaginibacter koreensis]
MIPFVSTLSNTPSTINCNRKSKPPEWLPIEDYPNYLISRRGEVRSIIGGGQGRILCPVDNSYGYKRIALRNNQGTRILRVHRLVAQAFLPNPGNLPMVNHRSGDKSDNSIENLEWATAQTNCLHAIFVLGAKRGAAMRPIRCVQTQQSFPSIGRAGAYFNVRPSTISRAMQQNDTGFHKQLNLNFEFI